MASTADRRSTDLLNGTTLEFFGKLTASATHEIKNSLAIINENAGLLQDLAAMAQNGDTLSSGRVADVSGRIERHVKKADNIVKRLNRFSHSTDHPRQAIDLERTLSFILDMGSRLLEMKGAAVTLIPHDAPIQINTRLSFFQALVWRCVEAACLKSDETEQLTISFDTRSGAPGIWFTPDMILQTSMETLVDSEKTQTLLRHLDISIEINIDEKRFGLILPNPN